MQCHADWSLGVVDVVADEQVVVEEVVCLFEPAVLVPRGTPDEAEPLQAAFGEEDPAGPDADLSVRVDGDAHVSRVACFDECPQAPSCRDGPVA